MSTPLEVEPISAVDAAGIVLGECPIWHAADQALYWLDIADPQLFRYDPLTDRVRRFPLDRYVGCIALHESGGLLMAGDGGLMLWQNDGQDGALTRLDIPLTPENRFNDGAVDRAGRFWIGTASDAPDNALYRVNEDGRVQTLETGIIISNGLGWSPDNRTMYYADSGGAGVVYAYDFDPEGGSLANRRVFLPPTGTPALPDGLTVDQDGFIWIAYWDGWRVCQYNPAGQLIRTLAIPVQRPTSVMFGGADLNDLYITSASQEMDRAAQPLAGGLFRVRSAARGLPEPITHLTATRKGA